MYKEILVGVVSSVILIGCSAKAVLPQAQTVEFVYKPVDTKKCTFVGETIGTQGNWFTGDWTSNQDLMIGARNDIKNQAFSLGGNTVFMENISNASAWGALGTTNTTIVGRAYKCVK